MKEKLEESVNKKGYAFWLMGTRQKFLDQSLQWRTGLRESPEIYHPKEAVSAIIAHFQILTKISSEPSPTVVFGVLRKGDTIIFCGDKFPYVDFVRFTRKK